jgi:hypothetical protein
MVPMFGCAFNWSRTCCCTALALVVTTNDAWLLLLDDSEIAQRLHIAVKTVETHLTSIYGKLGVQSRAEANARACCWKAL